MSFTYDMRYLRKNKYGYPIFTALRSAKPCRTFKGLVKMHDKLKRKYPCLQSPIFISEDGEMATLMVMSPPRHRFYNKNVYSITFKFKIRTDEMSERRYLNAYIINSELIKKAVVDVVDVEFSDSD